jgi:hypothetical protein
VLAAGPRGACSSSLNFARRPARQAQIHARFAIDEGATSRERLWGRAKFRLSRPKPYLVRWCQCFPVSRVQRASLQDRGWSGRHPAGARAGSDNVCRPPHHRGRAPFRHRHLRLGSPCCASRALRADRSSASFASRPRAASCS